MILINGLFLLSLSASKEIMQISPRVFLPRLSKRPYFDLHDQLSVILYLFSNLCLVFSGLSASISMVHWPCLSLCLSPCHFLPLSPSLFLYSFLTLSVSLDRSLCLRLSLSLCLSLCLNVSLSVYLCLCVSLSVTLCLCLSLSISVSVSVSMYLSVCFFLPPSPSILSIKFNRSRPVADETRTRNTSICRLYKHHLSENE